MGTIRVSSYMTLKFGLTQQKVKHNCIWNTISHKFPTVFIKKKTKQKKPNPPKHLKRLGFKYEVLCVKCTALTH